MPVDNSSFRLGRNCMSAVLTFAVLLMTLKALAIQKTDPKSGPSAKGPQQALAMAALEAIDLNEVESEKVHKTPALGDTARQARLAIEKLPRSVALCGPPPEKVDPESGAKEYCSLVRLDLESLLNKAEGVSRASALSLDPGNNDRKEELVRAIKEYQALRAWLEARLKKWNLYKWEPAVPTRVAAVRTDKESNPVWLKSRPQEGADAGVVMLDPQIVQDRSTYQHHNGGEPQC